jgi:hypothetical protein
VPVSTVFHRGGISAGLTGARLPITTRPKKARMADKGAYKILVGSSSRDLRLNGEFKLTETTVEK